MSTNKLNVSAPADEPVIILTRTFDAPRELVFAAMTDPELIPKWWGGRRSTTEVDEMDVRPGGRWRFVEHDSDGNDWAFRGEFREIVPPERVTQTFEFEGMPGHISVDTMTLEEEDGHTKITAVSRFDSFEDRDGMLQSGMEEGAAETYDQLEELVTKQAQREAPQEASQEAPRV